MKFVRKKINNNTQLSIILVLEIFPAIKIERAKAEPLIKAWNRFFFNNLSASIININIQKAAFNGPYSKYKRIGIKFVKDR